METKQRKSQPGDYHYFRLYDDFFYNSRIIEIEELEDDGQELILLYLELCTLASRNNGMLINRNNTKVEANNCKTRLFEDEKWVAGAFLRLIDYDLVIKDEDSFYHIPYLLFNTGISNPKADKVRKANRVKLK